MSSDNLRQRPKQAEFDGTDRQTSGDDRVYQQTDPKLRRTPKPIIGDSDEDIVSSSGFSIFGKIALLTFLFVPVLTFSIYISVVPPDNLPVEFSLPDPPKLEGPLDINKHLLIAEKLFEGEVIGPESVIYQKGHFFTGTSDGRIVHITNNEVKTIAYLGTLPCGNYSDEPTCGRPLGMKFDPDGYLVVCDAYLGLFRVDVDTGDVQTLVSSQSIVNGRRLNFLNALDIAADGTVYFTDSSVYSRRDHILNILDGRGTGRLLRYDVLLNQTELLLDNLHFANGVQLSRYEDYVLVAETARARIVKYNLKGINAGHSEIFAENLPGLPDNIKPSSNGGYWVASGMTRYQGKSFNGIDFIGSRTWLRKILSWLPVSLIEKYFPAGSLLMEFNTKGEIVRTLMDLNGENVRYTSEVEDDAGILYLGSYKEPYIARINTHKL